MPTSLGSRRSGDGAVRDMILSAASASASVLGSRAGAIRGGDNASSAGRSESNCLKKALDSPALRLTC